MFFSKLGQIPLHTKTISTFKGYRHKPRIADGEFYDMKNLTVDHYPLLSPRNRRLRDDTRNPAAWDPKKSKPQAMTNMDGLCFLSDGILYYGEQGGVYESVELGLSAEEKAHPKELVKFGSYLIVLPDKVYFNTKDPTDFGSIEAEFVLTAEHSADVTYTLCDKEGNAYAANAAATAPEAPVDGQYWLDISNYHTEHISVLKQYSAALDSWNVISPTYLKICAEGIGEGFEVGDWVCVSGADVWQINSLRRITEGSHEIVGKGKNAQEEYILLRYPMAEAERAVPNTEDLQIRRQMPLMDFLFEHENRLWGCRYGYNSAGEFVNEIYASKLGDFKNWSSFQGISTDSYVASCGTDGPWTGAIRAMGYPLFFKENYLHKVYGSYPAEYQIQTIACRGVQEGCEKSLAAVNEMLFYKSRSGVCVYDGSLPADVSDALGDERYFSAVAGSVKDKYYISMQNVEGGHELFCFDTQKGFWHKEDGLQVQAFCTVGDELFYIGQDSPYVYIMSGAAGSPAEEKVSWFAETGLLGTDDPERKYLSRITVRLSLDMGTQLRFYAQYDSSQTWESLAAITGQSFSSFSIPLRPKRCDHLRLRIEGEGDAKIYAITLTTEKGSDLR